MRLLPGPALLLAWMRRTRLRCLDRGIWSPVVVISSDDSSHVRSDMISSDTRPMTTATSIILASAVLSFIIVLGVALLKFVQWVEILAVSTTRHDLVQTDASFVLRPRTTHISSFTNSWLLVEVKLSVIFRMLSWVAAGTQRVFVRWVLVNFVLISLVIPFAWLLFWFS